MSKEYVFWFILIKRSAWYFDSVFNNSRKLIKVVITEGKILFEDPIDQVDKQYLLSISLPNIAEIAWEVTSPGTIGFIKIVTQEAEQYYLTPANPLDPTFVHVPENIGELNSFCEIVNALNTNKIPDVDENPYIRQFQSGNKPVYIKSMTEIQWDKNISPWEYYNKFVPASEEKKRRRLALIKSIILLATLTIMLLVFLYSLLFNFI